MKAFQDELAKESIDQLHKTVLQMSSNCFEIKKLCATVLVAAITLVATLTGAQLDPALWCGAAVVVVVFWLLDAQSYYYQEKLRARMKELAESRAKEHTPQIIVDGVGMPLTNRRENWNTAARAWHAVFNQSMAFYWLLLAMAVGVAILYSTGLIHSFPAQGGS